jgi:hypothetical protein
VRRYVLIALTRACVWRGGGEQGKRLGGRSPGRFVSTIVGGVVGRRAGGLVALIVIGVVTAVRAGDGERSSLERCHVVLGPVVVGAEGLHDELLEDRCCVVFCGPIG